MNQIYIDCNNQRKRNMLNKKVNKKQQQPRMLRAYFPLASTLNNDFNNFVIVDINLKINKNNDINGVSHSNSNYNNTII